MDTRSFHGIKRPGRAVDHPPHLVPKLKEEESYTPIWGFMACYRENIIFTFTFL
jgi:hypothetical protein